MSILQSLVAEKGAALVQIRIILARKEFVPSQTYQIYWKVIKKKMNMQLLRHKNRLFCNNSQRMLLSALWSRGIRELPGNPQTPVSMEQSNLQSLQLHTSNTIRTTNLEEVMRAIRSVFSKVGRRSKLSSSKKSSSQSMDKQAEVPPDAIKRLKMTVILTLH